MREDDIAKKLGSLKLSKVGLSTKLIKRMREQKEFQEKLEQLKHSFIKLMHCSTVFRKTFLDLSPGAYSLTYIINERIDWERMIKDKSKKSFRFWLVVVYELCREFGIEILMVVSKGGEISVSYYLGRDPIREAYEVKGKNIEYEDFNKIAHLKTFYKEYKAKTHDIFKKWAKDDDNYSEKIIFGGRLLDEVEIKDKTNGEAKIEIVKALAFTSRSFPTVLKYAHWKGPKKLFVSLPEYMDPSTFFKEYGKVISKIHSDFFEKAYHGRPKGKDQNLEFIRKIWKEKCEGKKMSKNQQAKIISDELGKVGLSLEPISITRHYLPLIKEGNPTKNR